MKEFKTIVDELGNYIDSGVIIYKNKRYEFENYYYDSASYVMINYREEYELEDGAAQNEIIEVGRINDDAVRVREIEKGIYEIEPLPSDENI